jgi:hypothetical protein
MALATPTRLLIGVNVGELESVPVGADILGIDPFVNVPPELRYACSAAPSIGIVLRVNDY